MEQREKFSNWKSKLAYGNVYRLIPTTADGCITCTDTNVDTKITLSARHRLIKMQITYMTDAYVLEEGTSYLVQLYRAQGDIEDSPHAYDMIYDNGWLVGHSFEKKFGEGDEFEETTFTLRVRGTETYKIAVLLYVQVEGVKRHG